MKTTRLKKTLEPERLCAIADTREQTPLSLLPLKVERGTLDTGDYSIKGLEHVVTVERKSLQDLVMCCGRERERFDREIQRLLAYPCKAMVIESHISHIELKQYRGDMHPNAIMGSVMGWMVRGLPIIWAGDHMRAGQLTAKFLYSAAKRRWLENYPLFETVLDLESQTQEVDDPEPRRE